MSSLPQRIAVKVYAGPGVHWRDRSFHESCIRALHGFIQTQALPMVPIDVHDYGHLHDGPGPMLVAYEAHLRLDRENGEFGLKVAWKRGLSGDWQQRLDRVFDVVLQAARLLEHADGLKHLHFDQHRFRLWIEDRLLTPNTEAAWEQLAPALEAFSSRRFGPAAVWSPSVGGEEAIGATLEIAPEAA